MTTSIVPTWLLAKYSQKLEWEPEREKAFLDDVVDSYARAHHEFASFFRDRLRGAVLEDIEEYE